MGGRYCFCLWVSMHVCRGGASHIFVMVWMVGNGVCKVVAFKR